MTSLSQSENLDIRKRPSLALVSIPMSMTQSVRSKLPRMPTRRLGGRSRWLIARHCLLWKGSLLLQHSLFMLRIHLVVRGYDLDAIGANVKNVLTGFEEKYTSD